jgi:hypothetical protein
VAFSLVALLSEEELPMKNMFVTSTLVIIMFTVFFQVHLTFSNTKLKHKMKTKV